MSKTNGNAKTNGKTKEMDPKAKARLERDMANLRRHMKDLGKQLEKECGMKDFDPLKNMNPKYPFNIIPDNTKKQENPFGPNFPFNDPDNPFHNTQSQPNNPFGEGFPFNQPHTNPFGQNNPFFENLFKNTNAYCFTPPPGFMENGFRFTPNGFEFDQEAFKYFKPQPNPFYSVNTNPFGGGANPYTDAYADTNPFPFPFERTPMPDFGTPSSSSSPPPSQSNASKPPIIEEINDDEF